MSVAAGLGIIALTLIAAEFAAAAVHRWVMHGPGWRLHRSHHRRRRGRREANDLYSVAFAAADLGLFALSGGPGSAAWWIAAGIALYGALYAWVHDGLVHRRWPAGRAPAGGWIGRLVRAHRLHHASRGRDGAVSFGFLWAPSPVTLEARLAANRARAAARNAGHARHTRRARVETLVGLSLALAIMGGWAALLALTLSGRPRDLMGPWTALGAVPLVALQSWLGAGLFIVAHDAMHGSLAPAAPRLGRALATLALGLYAGFPFAALQRAHHVHHRAPGTPADPDFDAGHPDRFWPWYGRFVRRYFGWPQALTQAAVTLVALGPLGVAPADLFLFWVLPSLLSSLQLFRWGTWLPHRHDGRPFADAHRTHSDPRGPLVTLATCFHFGLHHAHHLRPGTPWWRLPAYARRLQPRHAQPPSSAHRPAS